MLRKTIWRSILVFGNKDGVKRNGLEVMKYLKAAVEAYQKVRAAQKSTIRNRKESTNVPIIDTRKYDKRFK